MKKRGGVVVSVCVWSMVRSWLLRRGRFMVAVAAAVGLRYEVSAVAFSTGGLRI